MSRRRAPGLGAGPRIPRLARVEQSAYTSVAMNARGGGARAPDRADDTQTVRALIDAFRPPGCPVSVEAATRRGLDFLAGFRASGSPRVGTLDTALAFLGLLVAGTGGRRDQVRRRLTAAESSVSALRDLARFAQRLATVVIYATLDADGRPRRPGPSATTSSRIGRGAARPRCRPSRGCRGSR